MPTTLLNSRGLKVWTRASALLLSLQPALHFFIVTADNLTLMLPSKNPSFITFVAPKQILPRSTTKHSVLFTVSTLSMPGYVCGVFQYVHVTNNREMGLWCFLEFCICKSLEAKLILLQHNFLQCQILILVSFISLSFCNVSTLFPFRSVNKSFCHEEKTT